MMDKERNCPKCGADLPANAPKGLCPQCLMRAGMQVGSEDKEAGSSDVNRSIPISAAPPGGFVPPEPGQLSEKFPQLEIIELLGQGGMGAVYKARQKQLDRFVALKILPPQVGRDSQDSAFAERFTREAKALANLNHPSIVTLYEFNQADGLFYFLMEFVDGVNLRQLLEAGRLAPREALAIVPQICDALQYAHDEGIVHRDIKPENILLDRQGRVKVADFGLAKLVAAGGELSCANGAAASSVVLTEAGKVMGTPQYMAPEQVETPAAVDHRADIYSLGVVFYQMLTGELPGKRIEPPSRKVQVDVRLDEVVLRALEKEPEQRYQHVSQVKSVVETIAGMPATQVAASATDQPQTGGSPPRLLKVGKSTITTPEKLATAAEQFFHALRYKSQLLLDEHQLTFSGAGTHTVIPLASIRDL
ncbi:MAG: serine/threonine-protein kinase, partial [Planctomycetota bacterium]